MAREHIREARLDAHADQREQPALEPALVLRELCVPELHVRLVVRPLGMGRRQRHRHVEVRAARVEGGSEDLRIETRVGGIDGRRGEALVVERRNGSLGAADVDIRECHLLENPRRRATAATALPTPPAPTTRIRITAP